MGIEDSLKEKKSNWWSSNWQSSIGLWNGTLPLYLYTAYKDVISMNVAVFQQTFQIWQTKNTAEVEVHPIFSWE